MDFNKINQDVTSFTNGITEWAVAALPNLIAALLILGIGWWLSGAAARAIGRVVERQPYVDPTLHGVLKRLVRWGLLVVVFVAALSQLGVATTSMLAALGAIGLAIGLALQGTLANIAAGVMILWLRPFRVGDYIDAADVSGTVNEVGLFVTNMTTFEGVAMFVPNSKLWDTRVINYSRSNPRMVRETFGIAYEDDISKARKVLLAMIADNAKVLNDPEPIIYVSSLGDNSVGLEMRAWTKGPDWVQTRFELIEGGKLALDAAGITIPFPQRDLHIKDMPTTLPGASEDAPSPKKLKSA